MVIALDNGCAGRLQWTTVADITFHESCYKYYTMSVLNPDGQQPVRRSRLGRGTGKV
ncbi:protein of unknown function [Agrobacterium pusense]|uniref:Uncharacterized protein n=1 Tax=Agrobacterium pusense TaxID=648995 RepID=U4Q2G3_9HYPH|nr:protein of unknown function [Agrobacterium pusense]